MRLRILFLLMSVSVFAAAQRRKPLDFQRAVSINPLALAQIDFTFMVGAEWRLRPTVSFAPEAGYIFASAYMEGQGTEGSKARGFILRPSLKLYVNQQRNFYLQPQVFYKQVTSEMEDWVGKDCVDGVPAYEKLETLKMRRQVYGLNMVAGKLVPAGEKVLFDFYFGLGFRHKSNKYVGDEHSCYDPPAMGIFFGDDEGTFPSLPLGVRVIYRLN